MADEPKKSKLGLLDLGASLRGITNIVSGKVIDPKTWSVDDLNPPAAPTTPAVPVKKDDDDEYEETITRRRRKGGAFAPAPKAKPAEPAEPGTGKPVEPGGDKPSAS